MKRHIGSTFALIFGIISVLAGISQASSLVITGSAIVLGALAYKSAKKRKIGAVHNGAFRKVLELIAIVGAILLILLQNNILQRIESDPVPNLIIPSFIIIAYVSVLLWKPKKKEQKAE